MAPRTGSARPREIDFSAVGKAGRRTGITLPQQRLDEHGLEEVSHLFSSPKKPSPLKKYVLAESIQEEEPNALTPKPALSTRKTPRASIPRSASPRKSGISGTAKRTNGLDIRSSKKGEEFAEPEEQENAIPTSPTRANQAARRFISVSPQKAPLRDITTRNTPMHRQHSEEEEYEEEDIVESVENSYHQPVQTQQATPQHQSLNNVQYESDDVGPIISDGEDDALGEDDVGNDDANLSRVSPEALDDEDSQYSLAPEAPALIKNIPNSRRKRKSDLEMPDTSPIAKRPRNDSPPQSRKGKAPLRPQAEKPGFFQQAQPKARDRPPLNNKTTNANMSARQEKEVEDYIERIKSRPNAPKSLHILRRETPADDSVNITRSGRVSIKPLAYWRNERCVWGQSPNSATLQDGARFPLNSIKEVVRIDDAGEATGVSKKRKGKKAKKSGSKSRSKTVEPDDSSDSELDGDLVDPGAEEWETSHGILRGHVAVFDPELQTSLDEEEEIEIAYAPTAIETNELKKAAPGERPNFRYCKLLGNKFMGVGLVDLPPNGVKNSKNSRKMHMSFYVIKGRVTVTMGMAGAEPNKFSIGKGGLWQVPRGNQYAIENNTEKSVRLFFSQGCEVEVGLEDE